MKHDIAQIGIEAPRPGASVGIATDKTTLWFNKVVSLAVELHPSLLEDQDIREAAAKRDRLSAAIESARPMVQAIAAEHTIPLAWIKGVPMKALYEVAKFRDLGDLDVLTNTIDNAWTLASHLRERGFGWSNNELPWIKRDVSTGELYGQFAVWKWINGLGLAVRVDIHFGGYSVRHCAHMDVPVPPGVTSLDVLRNVPLIVANAAGDFAIRLKDLNDLAVMLLKFPRLDQWRDVLEILGSVDLYGFWNRMLIALETNVELDKAAQELAHLLYRPNVEEEHALVGRANLAERALATVAHARRVGGQVFGDRYAASAYQYYVTPAERTFSIRCKHESIASLIDTLANDTCVQLMSAALIRERFPSADAWQEGSQMDTSAQHAANVDGSSLLRTWSDGQHTYIHDRRDIYACTIAGDLCLTQLSSAENQGGFHG
jgi:hypothetical protein